MCCFFSLLAVLVPRVAIVLLWLLTDFMSAAYQTLLWPLLGLVFMPFTTIAYAFAVNATAGNVHGIYLVIVVVAVLVDLGALGGSGRSASARRRKV